MGCCSGAASGCHKVPGKVCPAISWCPRAGQAKCTRTDDGPVTMGRVTWPSDVTASKLQIDPSMRATDAAVSSCADLPAGTRAAWRDFFAAWSAFRNESDPWIFGSANKYDDAQAFRAQLGGWQEQLRAQGCGIPGPVVSKDDPIDGMISAIKWGAAAVIVASVVYGVRAVLK